MSAPVDADRPLSLSQILVRMNIAAGFSAVFTAISMAVLTPYAKSLQLPLFGFGVLAAIPSLAMLAQIPASFMIERFGHRKMTAILGILIHRGLWLLIALVPWVVPRPWWWLGLLVGVGLTNFSANIGTPATVSWAADLVPSRLRGRYYGLRGQLMGLIAIPLGFAVGWMLDRAQADSFHTLLLVMSVLLGVAALFGMVDSLLCLKLPDRWHQPRAEGIRFRALFATALRDHNFRCFLGYSAFITLATGYIGPFVWLYLIDEVGCSNFEGIVMTMVGTGVISLLGMGYWGSKVDRWGIRRTMLIAGVLIINGATTWLCITPGTKILGYIPVLLSAFAWPAMNLAGSNLLFSLSETRKDGTHPGSAYPAIASTVGAIFGTISGIFGGAVAETLKGWHQTIFGYDVTYFAVLFFLSAALRIIALFFVAAMRDERASVRVVKTEPVSEL